MSADGDRPPAGKVTSPPAAATPPARTPEARATVVGQGINRVEGALKVTGRVPYAPETDVANAVRAVLVTATSGPGRLTGIDTADAQRAPGVLAVITHKNALHLPGAREHSMGERVLQLLQDDVVLYNDQPVAVVVADTLENAQHAASLVRATTEGKAVNVDLQKEQSPPVKPEKTPRGPADTDVGKFERDIDTAAVQVDQTYTTPSEHHNPMEPHGTVAVWQADDRLTVYDSTQGVYGVRGRLAKLFGLRPENVRVVSLFIGGGFGCKGTPWSHVPLAAMAAKMLGRPVRLSLTRHQMFSLVGHRPVTRQHLVLGADAKGRLLAMRHDVLSATSRFDDFVEPSASQTRMLYACPSIRTSHRLVRLDIPTPTFTRAPGESSGSYALESAMDELAYALKIDPLELRLRNYADQDPTTGHPFSSKSLRTCYQRGAELFGWAKRRPAPRSMRDGRFLIGWGMATATYPAGQSPASAEACLFSDGRAVVRTASHDLGTGTYTVMAQVAADALGLTVSRVRLELGDTRLPEAPLSAGSRTVSSVGSAVKGAADRLREKLVALAIGDARSPLHGAGPDDVEVRDGILRLKSAPAHTDDCGAVLRRSELAELVARYDAHEMAERKGRALHSFGAQFAEVRVDPDLGEVRLQRMVGAFAAGKILNAKTARSQFIGGMVWGIGMALTEHTERDPRTGRVVTRDLADYHVPVHLDVPPIEIITVDEVDPYVNEIGAKGIGEVGTTGAAAAIANAVFHATGKRARDLPITLDKLL